MDTYKSEADDKVLAKLAKIVVVDIFSSWCGPCKALSPILDQLEAEYSDKAKFVKIDVSDDPPQFVIDMGIRVVPTILFYKNGILAQTESGYRNREVIVGIIDILLAD